jgi:plastocyanin
VNKGSKVTWRWKGKSVHNVTVTKGPARFHSATKSSGTFTKKLKRAGTYTLICTVHGAKNQSMKLVVR